MTDTELERFLSYLVRFTCEKQRLDINCPPAWWTESVEYEPAFAWGSGPVPETRNKHVKLRRLVKLCYLHYGCKSLLIVSEQLANLSPLSYKFMRDPSGAVAVYRMKTMTAIAWVPASNMDYDVDRKFNVENEYRFNGEVTLTPTRKSLLGHSPAKPNSDEECIVIDSDTSSDDEVQIVSYEPGALPRTPPKVRPPIAYRPGPACSKNRPPRPLPGPACSKNLPQPLPGPACSKSRPPRPFVGPASVQQRLAMNMAVRQRVPAQFRPIGPAPTARPSFRVYQPPTQPRVLAKNKYLQCRPRRDINIEKVDLTIFDSDEDVDQPTAPKDLSQTDFLARIGLVGSSESPTVPKRPVASQSEFKKTKRLNLRQIPCTMIPHLVTIGYLPRRALCTTSALAKTAEFIDKFTKKDTNWFLVSVNLKDAAAVAAVVRKCCIPVKRLTTAGLRRWRR